MTGQAPRRDEVFGWRPLLAFAVLAVLAAPGQGRGQGLPSGDSLLRSAIEHHDPRGVWDSARFRLTLESHRPDGSRRRTILLLDNAEGTFQAERVTEAGRFEARIGPGDLCRLELDGSTEIPAEIAESLRLDCDRWRLMRDYYSYMWGLPMKLRDPGTRVDRDVARADFQGREALVLRVTYDAEVGGDTWYVYLEPTTARALGYRFYHDEAKNDGEYITLDGVVEAGGVRFPRSQTWYMNDDDELLGSDVLLSAEALH